MSSKRSVEAAKPQLPEIKGGKLPPYYAQLASQFVTPASCSGANLVVAPSSYPQQVCVRHIHKVIDVSSDLAGYGTGFTVLMSPDPFLPGFVTSTATVTVPTAGPGALAIDGGYGFGAAGAAQTMSGPGLVIDGEERRGIVLPVAIADSAAVTRYGFSFVPAPATVMTVKARKSDFPGVLQLSVFNKAAAGAWTAPTVIPLSDSWSETRITTSANMDAVTFTCTNAVGQDEAEVDIFLSFGAAQVTSLAANSFAPAFGQFVYDNSVKRGALRSMSLLATNTSPDLADGGNVNIARVPCGFNPFGDVVARIANLPENRRYQGPAKSGGYAFWVPSQVDEYEVDNIGVIRQALWGAEYILLQVRGWAPPAGSVASFRLQFDWVFEFYTPNQLFEKELTPARTQEFEELYHLVLALPAATCNPEHGALLKDLLKRSTAVIKSGHDFYRRNQPLIDALGKLLLTLI
jgi:hypothetical protein